MGKAVAWLTSTLFGFSVPDCRFENAVLFKATRDTEREIERSHRAHLREVAYARAADLRAQL